MSGSAGGKQVVLTLPVLLIGGTEVQTLQQARVLIGAGYQVTVCCLFQHDGEMCKEMERAGARVVLLGADRTAGLWSLLFRLVAWFRRQQPDIVHVQYMAPGFIPVLAARLAGVHAVFATVHQPGWPYGIKAHLSLRAASLLCTMFFCNSLAVETSWFGSSALLDVGRVQRRRHWTIYNAVDVEKVAAAVDGAAVREQLGLGAGPVIGCIGRLRGEKGQRLLVESMPRILAAFPHAVLLLVGDGPDRDSLERRVRELGLEGNIRFLGRCHPEGVPRLLAAMDVVAVPSVFEGFGLAAIEAMAAGRPVVATAVDGLAEVVEHGVSGLLVPAGDAAALASAVCDVLQEPVRAREMGRHGRRRVLERYSLEAYREALVQAYARLG